jgi:hypothetical protein
MLFIFDDYFCYRGHPDHGVRGAFRKWLSESGYRCTSYLNYSWAGKVFIIHRDGEFPQDQLELVP